MADRIGPWTRISRQCIYDNAWIRVSHDDVLTPAGTPGIYGMVHYKNKALGVVALDSAMNLVLVGQHRYPLDLWTWEIPEGGVPAFEDPLAGIKRELAEETGFSSERWILLAQDLMLSNSVSDECADLWMCMDIVPGPSSPEETEELQVQTIPLQKAIDQVLYGEIRDAMSVMAILLAEKKLISLGFWPLKDSQ